MQVERHDMNLFEDDFLTWNLDMLSLRQLESSILKFCWQNLNHLCQCELNYVEFDSTVWIYIYIYLEPSPTQIDSDRSKACLGLQLQLQSAMADRGWDHAAWQQYRSTSRHMRLTADVNCSPAASGELRGKVWPIQGWNLDIAAVGNIELRQACRLQAILVVCNDWGNSSQYIHIKDCRKCLEQNSK